MMTSPKVCPGCVALPPERCILSRGIASTPPASDSAHVSSRPTYLETRKSPWSGESVAGSVTLCVATSSAVAARTSRYDCPQPKLPLKLLASPAKVAAGSSAGSPFGRRSVTQPSAGIGLMAVKTTRTSAAVAVAGGKMLNLAWGIWLAMIVTHVPKRRRCVSCVAKSISLVSTLVRCSCSPHSVAGSGGARTPTRSTV